MERRRLFLCEVCGTRAAASVTRSLWLYPFGLGGSVQTAGTASAQRSRYRCGVYMMMMCRSMRSINKGSSGGSVFEMHGNVIGVNNSHLGRPEASAALASRYSRCDRETRGQPAQGQGPYNAGHDRRAGGAGHAEHRRQSWLEAGEEATVDSTEAGGPAAKAGIEAGDVITSINGNLRKDCCDDARSVGAMALRESGEKRRPARGRNENRDADVA